MCEQTNKEGDSDSARETERERGQMDVERGFCKLGQNNGIGSSNCIGVEGGGEGKMRFHKSQLFDFARVESLVYFVWIT